MRGSSIVCYGHSTTALQHSFQVSARIAFVGASISRIGAATLCVGALELASQDALNSEAKGRGIPEKFVATNNLLQLF